MTSVILSSFIIGMVISVVLATFISKIGAKKQIGGSAAFIISLFLSPLVGLVVVLASEDLKEGEERKPLDGKAVAVSMVVVLAFFAAIAASLEKATSAALGEVDSNEIIQEDTSVIQYDAVDAYPTEEPAYPTDAE